jgi:RNA recognition motif-containing protein
MITYTPSNKSASSYTSNESPSSQESTPNSTLFVGDLSLFTNEVDLYNLFIAFGELVEIKIMRCEETMKNLSYGFVKFIEHESAVNSMKGLHGYILNGRPLR